MGRAITQQDIAQRAISRGPRRTVTFDRVTGKILLVLLVLMASLSAAGAGGAFLLKPGTARKGVVEGETTRAPANYAKLPAMSFTLSDGERLRDLRVRVVLEMEPEVLPKSVESYGPRIASALNARMLEVTPDELKGRAGSLLVKDAVMQTARQELRPMKVREVLLQELVMR